MKKITRIFILIIVQVTIFFNLSLEGQRFPKPEFESGHSQPLVLKPEARALMWEYIDIFVLVLYNYSLVAPLTEARLDITLNI